jgi:hypothetical protein
MGNEASTAVKVAQAKGQFNQTMKKINTSLDGTAKKDTDGLVGVKNRKEANTRRKERESDYKLKQKERTERKSKLSQQWSEHRTQNAEPQKKSVFGRKKQVDTSWMDDD